MDELRLQGSATDGLLLQGSATDVLLLQQTVGGGGDVIIANDPSAIEQGVVAQTAAGLGGVLVE